MAAFRTLDGLSVAQRRVLVRLDLNVPMADRRVTGTERASRALPTIRELADAGARTVILSHLGRPGGRPVPELSLAPVAETLGGLLGQPVAFAGDVAGPLSREVVAGLGAGEVAMLENLRFDPGEEDNDPAFASVLARLGDVFVNDAFSVSHRAHASVAALARLLPGAAGRLMEQELDRITTLLGAPARPFAAIVGGAKISSKLALLERLCEQVDLLVVGGAMANTFLAARGVDVGASLHEPAMTACARDIMARAKGRQLLLPVDAVVADADGAPAVRAVLDAVGSDERILDIGPTTAETVAGRLGACRTMVWNGPLGAFERTGFDTGTSTVARAAAQRTRAQALTTVAGGGDTAAALSAAGVLEDFTYVSTAGGAFLAWLEGAPLPGLVALEAGG